MKELRLRTLKTRTTTNTFMNSGDKIVLDVYAKSNLTDGFDPVALTSGIVSASPAMQMINTSIKRYKTGSIEH